jgi:hypothetical protein
MLQATDIPIEAKLFAATTLKGKVQRDSFSIGGRKTFTDAG